MTDIASLRPGDPESIGGYALTGRIGEGGQGSVYLGTTPSGERVAIKVLRRGLVPPAPGSVASAAPERFQRETEILRRVAPFCTAQVVESGTAAGRPYIVSEYIEGPTLQQSVERDGPLRDARLRRLAVGTMTALTAIHRAGIVHRDFKPSNVLLGRDGPRVIDFGIARALDVSATGSGAIGTPPYMAPEQLDGAPVEPPADLFSWGSTMVFAATGRPPFGMDSLPAVINRILHRDPDLGDLEGDLRDLIAECLAKNPAVRPAARDVLLRLLGAQGRPSGGGDLLSAGTAAASDTPQRATALPVGAPPPGGVYAAPGGPVSTDPGTAVFPTQPDVAAGSRRGLWIGAGVALALVSAALAYIFIPRDVTGPVARPTPSAPSASPVREVTAAPPTPAAESRLPETKTTVYENPDDPVRLTSFMYLGSNESKSYARDTKGEFESTGPYQEPLVSPDGTWMAILPWLKDSIPQPYDQVRLVERSTGREFAVRLTDKPLQNFVPYWSSDGRRLLLTTYEVSPTNQRTSVGFVIVDRDTATSKAVSAPTPGAQANPFMWAPGETSVAQRYLDGNKPGIRIYDLTGKALRTIANVGNPIDYESMFSPAGKFFVTLCPSGYAIACIWDTTTGRRVTTVPVPVKRRVVGWYNDAHLIVTDLSNSPARVTITNLKGKQVRLLAEIPKSEIDGNPYRLIPHYGPNPNN
ncbi:protein kinase domain-containing protein [Sphaerisporangium aureirubrum]|uniref:Protein kinase n=1 Tax=Sphaerisporangium aureirubrum TaxID=1544736 RepID=A0ABW1NBQ9_9ACTN